MSANLTAYYWAEETNRQRLSERAARGWQVEQATRSRPATTAARLRLATGTLLVRAGTRLQGIPRPGPVLPLATDGGSPS